MKGKASPTRLPSITPHAWDSLLASTRLSDCTLVMPSRSKASGVAHRSRGSIRIPCNKYVPVKAAHPTTVKPVRSEPNVSTSHGRKAAHDAGEIEWKPTAIIHPSGELPITRM